MYDKEYYHVIDQINKKCMIKNITMSYSYSLEAINLSLVSKTVESMSLDLLRKCMVSDSQTHKFYFHMLCTWRKGENGEAG